MTETTLNLDDDEPSTAPAVTRSKSSAKRASIKAKPKKVETVKIQLEETDNMAPTGQFFGLDGVGFNLRPGEPANVPIGILNVLNDAIMSVPIMNSDFTVSGYRDRLRFPYRILA